MALSGEWGKVLQIMQGVRGNGGAATRDLGQIRRFYEVKEEDLWITFFGGFLYWCRARGPAKKHADLAGSYRETVDGWHRHDIFGKDLTTDKLSGNLLKVQSYRGTICDVKAAEYLKRKLNGLNMPSVEAAIEARAAILEKIIPLMRDLTWQDFELLVDLVFSQSGWRRIGNLGKTQKTVDLELLMPTTGVRAFVQIKSQTTPGEVLDYIGRLNESESYDLMFFVWHSGDVGEVAQDDVILVGPGKLAEMVMDAGLVSWLIEKVS